MNGSLVSLEVRHAFLPGLDSRARRRRSATRAVLVVIASGGAPVAVARSSLAGEHAAFVVLAMPAVLACAAGLAAILLDHGSARRSGGCAAVLPMSVASQWRLSRVPWMVLVLIVTVVCSPSLLVVATAAGVAPLEGVLVIVASVTSGLTWGLACSVLGARARRRHALLSSAPVALVLWAVGVVLSGVGMRHSPPWSTLAEIASGWPLVARVLDGSMSWPTVSLWLALAAATSWWLAGREAPCALASDARLTWSFPRAPFATVAALRCWRNGGTRAHWWVAAAVALAATGLELRHPGSQAPQIALSAVLLSTTVCACSIRALDGPVSLDVRWFVGVERHVAAVMFAAVLVVAPLALPVLALAFGRGQEGVADPLLWMAGCLLGAAVGTWVSAVVGDGAGGAGAELIAVVAAMSSLGLAHQVSAGEARWIVPMLAGGIVAAAAGAIAGERRLVLREASPMTTVKEKT